MTLSAICTSALNEIGGFDVPSTFYENNDLTAKQCLALCTAELEALEMECRWSELVTEHTFATVSGTATYAKPSDFRAFANMSVWDRTNQWRMTGPIPSSVWQWLKSGISVASLNERWFMVRGAYISVYPTPTSADTIAFDYYSKNTIVRQADSSTSTTFGSDNDTILLEEGLVKRGLKWRFLQAKGMPYEPEYREWESILDALKADNGGRTIIDLNGAIQPRSNLPDTGFGQ